MDNLSRGKLSPPPNRKKLKTILSLAKTSPETLAHIKFSHQRQKRSILDRNSDKFPQPKISHIK
jgi:hypothetical protein